MYFPYLRGKEFELLSLLQVDPSVFSNTLPIIEPVSASDRRKLYEKVAAKGFPLIIVMNPYYPPGSRMSTADVQNIVNTNFGGHTRLTLGFIIDNRFTLTSLNAFLRTNPKRAKSLIFRYNPLTTDLISIQSAVASHPVQYVIFDDKKTNSVTRAAFSTHDGRVLLTDGFQRQEKNADYPANSTFDSNYSTWRSTGLTGLGDYQTIGDHFQEGGGQVFVVTLHITSQTSSSLLVSHFSSTIHSTTRGLGAQKFAEANGLLVASRIIRPLTSSGLTMYRDWDARRHNPQLGAAKQASIMHHIELMSSII